MYKKPKGRNDGHKTDYSKITDSIYVGSDLCQGLTCSVHSAKFKQLGVNAEINMSIERKEFPPDEVDIYAWIPVVDGYAPSEKQFSIGSSLINSVVEAGDVIFVHCNNGHARSPTMVASYLIRYKKKTLEQATEMIARKRPEIHIESIQVEALMEFAKKW